MSRTLDQIGENGLRVQIARLLDLFIVHDGDTALELGEPFVRGRPWRGDIPGSATGYFRRDPVDENGESQIGSEQLR